MRNRRILQILGRLKITQGEFAERIGTTPAVVSSWATGVRNMPDRWAYRINSAFPELSVPFILGRRRRLWRRVIMSCRVVMVLLMSLLMIMDGIVAVLRRENEDLKKRVEDLRRELGEANATIRRLVEKLLN